MNNLLTLSGFEILGIVFVSILVVLFVIFIYMLFRINKGTEEDLMKNVINNSSEETNTEENDVQEDIPNEEIIKERYTEKDATREILISMLKEAGVKGISKLKKSELIEKVKENNLEYPFK